jgi:hypothetical protein
MLRIIAPVPPRNKTEAGRTVQWNGIDAKRVKRPVLLSKIDVSRAGRE